MTNPFDRVPLELSTEAEAEKRRWAVVIAGLKGNEKRRQQAAYSERYGEPPPIVSSVQPTYTPNERMMLSRSHLFS